MLESAGPFLIFLVVILVIPGYIASIYNALVRLRNHISDAWSNVDTELMRRYELIPNLVAAVKGYAAHERETLERVIELRNTCVADTGSVRHQEGTEKQLVVAMQKLLALPGSRAVLQALGFKQEAGAPFYAWRVAGALPEPDDLELIAAQRGVLQHALGEEDHL